MKHEIRKTFLITHELDSEIKRAVKILGVTESAFIKIAIYKAIKGVH